MAGAVGPNKPCLQQYDNWPNVKYRDPDQSSVCNDLNSIEVRAYSVGKIRQNDNKNYRPPIAYSALVDDPISFGQIRFASGIDNDPDSCGGPAISAKHS